MKYRSYLLIVVCGVFAACHGDNKPVVLAPPASKKPKYQLGIVNEKGLLTSAQHPGQLVPFNEVNLFPKVNGFVKELYVDRGSIVKKGQLLVVLEAPEMESQLQAANSQYEQAKENALASKEKYERLSEAAKEPGSVSPLDLDNAHDKMNADEAMVQAQHSNVQSVQTMFDYLRIYAPFDGMIIQRNISPGALVAPGKTSDQPMLVLQDIHKMRLTVAIPEDYVDLVDLTKPVTYTLNAFQGNVFTAKISRSANSLGSMQQEAIEIDVMNDNGELKPGMYAEVNIPLRSGGTSLLVPNSAIVRSTELQYVVKDSLGKADIITIKEGLAGKDSTQVFGHLKAKDTVVLHANDEIKQGDDLQ
jgi:membrane fusion protein (multidrug efflux system)